MGHAGIHHCAVCASPFTYYGQIRRSQSDPHLCEKCQVERERAAVRDARERERQAAAAVESEPDWPDSLKVPELPEPVEDSEEDLELALAHALGEGPGPEDLPEVPPFSDAGQRYARIHHYHADVLAGRPIGFIHQTTILRPPAGGAPRAVVPQHASATPSPARAAGPAPSPTVAPGPPGGPIYRPGPV